MTTTASPPQRAEGLELLGALGGSGYRNAPGMVRRADGQTLQMTPLLYRVLEQVDGTRGPEQIAEAVSASTGKQLSADDVVFLVEDKLEPLGVIAGSEVVAAPTSNPLLALKWKVVLSDPKVTRRVTAPFAFLFHPLIMWPVLAAFVAVCWFVLVDKGLASATHSAFQSPGLLLAIFALAVVSAGVHELGHAAACRYGGAAPGAMGAGLYLVWPAFYTNVDDAYRLDRRGRLRVDLGGLYFNALVAVAVTAGWLATGEDALLLGVAVQLFQMLRQLAPVIRADGYHILADLTGVPDLFSHLGPTLRRVLPSHWHDPSPLTRRARWIVTGWVLVVVPVLLSMMLTGVLLLPRLAASAWAGGKLQVNRFGAAADRADVLGLGAGAVKLLALALPVVGTSYILVSVATRTWRRSWARTEGQPVARGLVTLTAGLVFAALAWAWWPHGQYRPVSATERGTISSLFGAQQASVVTPLRGTQIPALAMVPREAGHPTLLLVSQNGTLQTLLADGSGTAKAFPFSMPTAPGPGDTQALAVNGTDGATVYDVAYALVTVTDGAPVTNTNSAFALASCTRCTTVAVSFQVVLVVGQSNVVVPVNAAVAANGGCLQCVTSALAVQLVTTLNALPSAQVQQELNQALSGLANVKGLSPAAIYQEMQAVETHVVGILQTSGLLTGATSTSTQATATPSAGTSSSPTPDATASPAPADTPSATPSPTASDTPTATTSP